MIAVSSTFLRRTVYALLAGLGLIMMLPLLVQGRRLQAELAAAGPLDAMVDPALAGQLLRLGALFVLGLAASSAFLYAALSVGYDRAWRPRRDGRTRCGRCDTEVSPGDSRCALCGQRLVW